MNPLGGWVKVVLIVLVFLAVYWAPIDRVAVWGPVDESLAMLQDYAHQHVLLCLVPAFFIAGAVAVFVGQASVMKYLGVRANKVLAYGVASVSGTVLAVCSCTVLPLFAGIYRMGAGLGPATAFLYSGPAINVLAIILTARVLGLRLGAARAVGAVVFSVVIGLAMHLIFRKEELKRTEGRMQMPQPEAKRRLGQTAAYFAAMVGILVFANWVKPESGAGLWSAVYAARWYITGALCVALAVMLIAWFSRRELRQWCASTWEFALMILPLLFRACWLRAFCLAGPGTRGSSLRAGCLRPSAAILCRPTSSPRWPGRLCISRP